MTQLIVQADDMAITHASSLGILDSIRNGIVRSTGIFTNRPDAVFAARQLREIEGIDVGIDLNFVTGRPLLAPQEVPGLVEANGKFRSSSEIKRRFETIRSDGPFREFSVEPFDYGQTLAEAHAQVERFLELMERPPAYVHHHSLVTPTVDRTLREIATQYDLIPMDDVYRAGGLPLLPNEWYTEPFGLVEQSAADPFRAFERLMPLILANELSILITHPGYVDAELLDLSTYSVIRAHDHRLMTDKRVSGMLADAGVELVTYSTAEQAGRTIHDLVT